MAVTSQDIRWFPLDRIGELERAIAARLHSRRLNQRRDALFCALGLSGLRSGEVSWATTRDLFGGHSLRVRTEKGGIDRTVRLHGSVTAALWDWRSAKGVTSDLLLPSNRGTMVRREQPNRMAQRLFSSLLGPGHGLVFHSLRHTRCMVLCAYRDAKSGQPLHPFAIQKMMGHRSIATTLEYVHLTDSLPDDLLPRVDHDEALLPGQQLRLFAG